MRDAIVADERDAIDDEPGACIDQKADVDAIAIRGSLALLDLRAQMSLFDEVSLEIDPRSRDACRII